MNKTNAMRKLDREKIAYEVLEYEGSDGKIDGLSVAEKVGENPGYVYKTLVTEAGPGKCFVFIIPVEKELDLKKAALACKKKSVSMLHLDQLLSTTGYVRGGCSPIGMKKGFPTFIDQSACELAYIFVSGGKIGLQIKLKPHDLAVAAQAVFADLVRDS